MNKLKGQRTGTSKYDDVFKIGDTYGNWTVIDSTLYNRKNIQILVRCVCGKEQYAYPARLISGSSRGCRRCGTAGSNHYKWKGVGDIPMSSFYNIQKNAENSNREFDLTIEYIWELFIHQNKRCALSGRELYFLKSNTKRGYDSTASLDRIDSSIGYIRGNVQWIHKDINRMKSDLPQDKFINLCKEIASYDTSRSV